MKCEATARIPPRRFLAGTDVVERRGRTHPNSIDDIVANLVVNYELSGRLTLRVITEEATTPSVRDILAVGPTYHRKWCVTAFLDTMAGLPRDTARSPACATGRVLRPATARPCWLRSTG